MAALKAEGRGAVSDPRRGWPQLLAQEAFRQAAGFPAAPVHYPGSAPAVLAVIGGEFPFTIENLALVAPHLSGGALRALGVTSLGRAPLLPDVPTLAEQGVSGFSAGRLVWTALAGRYPGGSGPELARGGGRGSGGTRSGSAHR